MSEGWMDRLLKMGPVFASRAAAHDRSGEFVAENYEELKRHRLLSAQVPVELGGGGAKHEEVCELLRGMAHYCPSTALALSMHQHLVATAIWRWRHAKGSDALLRRVAAEQIVLVSTGANDWLESSGTMERVEGGYRLNAAKPFASGCPAGDIAVTSAPVTDPATGQQLVLHFAVSLKSDGVTLLSDWDTMGMRGTGSNTMVFENVFIPESAIVLQRPRGVFHPFWSVVLTVAMPLIMSVYLGVAEKARELALAAARKNKKPDDLIYLLAAEMENELTVCRLAVQDMVRLAANGDFTPETDRSSQILIRKTLAARSAIRTVEKAVELVGGRAYYRDAQLERLLRDVHAAQFHPLQEKPQQRFVGRVLLGVEPIG